MANFGSDQHALTTGMTIGYLIKSGLDAQPTLDANNDYQPVIRLMIRDESLGRGTPVYLSILDPESVTTGDSDLDAVLGPHDEEGTSTSPD